MFVEVITTITTKVDITTFDTEHDVDVAHDGPLPKPAVIAAALGAARSAAKTLEAMGA